MISSKQSYTLDTLPTPALVIDTATVSRNVEKLAKYAAQHKIGVRPHTKTHKSVRLSQMQLDAGAVGLTVAKVGEAEVMAGTNADLMLAYPAVDPARTQRIAALAREHTVRVAVDGPFAVETLAAAAREANSTIGLLVDIDVGMKRTGLPTPAEALKLAQLIDRTPGVRLDGLFCYPGHIWVPVDQMAEPLSAVNAILQQTLDLWKQNGLEAKIVSGGSTPTAFQSHHATLFTEIRPGTYVFHDMNCVHGNYCTLDDCAARIICTVVSDAVPGKVVLDGGNKTFTSDPCATARESGYGYIVEYPQAKIFRLSEEHGDVDVSACEKRPKVGERVTVVPNHICPCVNLQDAVWWREPDGEVHSLKVDARGKLS